MVYLNLYYVVTTDIGIKSLKNLVHLKYLNIHQREFNELITDEGILCLENMYSLTYLNLSNISVTASGLSIIKNFHKLKVLILNHNHHISTSAMEIIGSVTTLRRLHLKYCPNINDEGMKFIENYV